MKSSGVIPYSVNYEDANRGKYYKEILKKIKNGI
jgi:hypothetical protein